MPPTGPLRDLAAYEMLAPLPKNPADFTSDPEQIQRSVTRPEARDALRWLLRACHEHGRWAGFNVMALIHAAQKVHKAEWTCYAHYEDQAARIRNDWRRRCQDIQQRWRWLTWFGRTPQLPPKPIIDPNPLPAIGIVSHTVLRDRQGAPDLFEGFYRLEELKLVRITPQLGASHETVGIVYPTPELIWLLVWAQVPTVSD